MNKNYCPNILTPVGLFFKKVNTKTGESVIVYHVVLLHRVYHLLGSLQPISLFLVKSVILADSVKSSRSVTRGILSPDKQVRL